MYIKNCPKFFPTKQTGRYLFMGKQFWREFLFREI